MISSEVKNEIRGMFAEFANTVHHDWLFATANYDGYVEPDTFNNDFVEMVCNETKANECFNGASKLALMFDDKNYIIKIPIFGYSYENDNEDIVLHSYENAPQFYSAFPKGYDAKLAFSDYCMSEAKVFVELDKLGFGDMVAETDFVCMAGDFPVYVSDKVCMFDADAWRTTYYPAAAKFGVSSIVYSKYVSSYGVDRTDAFFSALVNLGISDLHDGNFGVTNNDKIVLIDYSDFLD